MTDITAETDEYGGTVIKRSETNYTVVHVQPMLFDPATPILIAFDSYESNLSLTVAETIALREALTKALGMLGEE